MLKKREAIPSVVDVTYIRRNRRLKIITSGGVNSHSRLWKGLTLFLLGLLTLSASCSGPGTVYQGAGVHGSIYALVGYSTEDDVKNLIGAEPIFLPDIEVFLRNISTGDESAPITTDLFGRYLFPKQKPGTYELLWHAQHGWAAGSHPDSVIIIQDETKFPIPARIVPTREIMFGRVTLLDGGSPWFYDELFSSNKTAIVTVLNLARTTTLAGPVHINANGHYVVAGLPRRENVTVNAQSEAATITRVVTSGNIVGGNAVNLELPNHRPQVEIVVPEVGGDPIQTAAPGTTVQLRAIASDADGDPLLYDWKVISGSGTLVPAGSSADWELPTTAGRYTVYLQVRDGRGGYARQRLDFFVDKIEEIFSGKAVDQSGAAVDDARVTVNGKTTTTDANGFFLVRAPLSNRYVLNITKRGYALFSRVVDSGAIGQTWRLIKAKEETVDPTQQITLIDSLQITRKDSLPRSVKITVPSNALVDTNGNKPSGLLTAYHKMLNIADSEAPGDWGAINTVGKETNLISYGAVFVEFRDAAGNFFNLAPGALADIEMDLPATMLAGAPSTATFWSYDEIDGYWKKSGVASFTPATGNFIGQVSHLSTINTDLSKDDAACLKVLIYPPIPTGVKLKVTDPTGTVFGQSFEFVLDAALNAVYRLPSNTDVRLELFDAENNQFTGLILEEVPGTPLSGNIVNSGPPIPPGQTLWPEEPYDACKLVILRLDEQADPSIFLTFMGEGNEAQANAYYTAVDPPDPAAGFPNGRRTTLGDWWETNGFTIGADGWPTNAVRTSYLNNNDLGSGRDMYFLQRSDGTVASFVTNYGKFDQNHTNADLSLDRNFPGATVCMEYSPVEGQGSTPIVKFFVFAGEGFKENAVRQFSANLDNFGEKFVPNLCLNCHGGKYTPVNPEAPTFAEVNMKASFRELDLETYKYPGGRLLPNAGEKERFKEQNLIVKGLNPGDAITKQAIKDLIDGWYSGASTDQDNTYTPPGWTGSPQRDLYHDVVKPSCRTCHVAFESNTSPGGINWVTYDQLKLRRFILKPYVLCESRFMPHAVVTYRNFWLSGSPHRPGVLRDFEDGTNWTKLGPCE